jgi:IstB-like ATP binding protein
VDWLSSFLYASSLSGWSHRFEGLGKNSQVLIAALLGSERLTGTLLDRLTHHAYILEMDGGSYHLKLRRKRSLQA